MGNAVARSAFYYPFRVGKLVVESHECFAVGIETAVSYTHLLSESLVHTLHGKFGIDKLRAISDK